MSLSSIPREVLQLGVGRPKTKKMIVVKWIKPQAGLLKHNVEGNQRRVLNFQRLIITEI